MKLRRLDYNKDKMDDNIDSKYEFNAPKYIDFLQGDVDEDADKWFGEENFIPLSTKFMISFEQHAITFFCSILLTDIST